MRRAFHGRSDGTPRAKAAASAAAAAGRRTEVMGAASLGVLEEKQQNEVSAGLVWRQVGGRWVPRGLPEGEARTWS